MRKLIIITSWAHYLVNSILLLGLVHEHNAPGSEARPSIRSKKTTVTQATLNPGCCSAAEYDFNANGVIKPARMAFIIGAQKSGR
jgi:hypothetical protein